MHGKSVKALYLGLILVCGLSACNKIVNEPATCLNSENPISSENSSQDNMKECMMLLTIDNKEVSVTWLDNESVQALKQLAKSTLTIHLSMYGGFEQVGSIGQTLPSNDTRITTIPGDIVLYSSNQIVIFYGSNTWSYTKLGHINLNESELEELLGQEDVTISLTSVNN